jgi:uncharacterized protein
MIEHLGDMDKLSVAAAFAAASRANDPEALRALSAPGAVTWHNFDEVEQSTDDVVRSLGRMHHIVDGLTWTDVAVKATTDGFVWQSILSGAAPGGTLRVHSCIVATLDADAKIVRVDEYLDTRQVAVLRR